MQLRTASVIQLSKKQRHILGKIAKGTHTPLHLKTRAQIILLAAAGWSNNAIEKTLKIDAKTVKRWRDRYSNQYNELQRTEAERPHKIRRTIMEVLSDEQRPGGPAKFTDEQVAAIIALACEDPMKFGIPFSHWTPQLLQIEVIKLGIVESISVRQIGRFLKGEGFAATSLPVLAES
jgi:putative transposase